MLRVMLLIAVLTNIGLAADVYWARFTGRVKGLNGKTSFITIQNKEGDLVSVKTDTDVTILKGKDEVGLGDVRIDDKVTLLYSPKAASVNPTEEPAPGGVYKPLR